MIDVFPPHVEELERLRAENAELRERLAEREWKPIETAPKDGTQILTFAVQSLEPMLVSSWYRGTWRDDGFDPSHWVTLPDIPELDAGRRSDDPVRKTEAASS